MNLINSSSIAKNDNELPLKCKGRAAHYYLYLVGLYIIFVFNEFLAKPVDFYALLLIIIGIPLIKQANIKAILSSIFDSKSVITIVVSTLILSVLFFVTTLFQLPRTSGIVAFFAQYGVHVTLSIMALLIIPLNKESANFIFKCLLVALLMLMLADIALYVWQGLSGQRLGTDYSHRWFGDGYVFLYPFLLVCLLNNKEKSNLEQRSRSRFLKAALYVILLLVMVLAGGTGARSTYGIILLQVSLFCYFKCRQLGLSRLIAIVSTLISFALVVNFFLAFLSPQLFSWALNRGLNIADRILYAWDPAIFFIAQSPFIAYGFGSAVWDEAFRSYVISNPNSFNFGSPHNWFLAAGFFGGVFAICAQLVMAIGIIYWLYVNIKNNDPEIRFWVLSFLASFISFYVFKGLVEFTIFKYLSITLIGVFLLNRISLKSTIDYPKS